MTIKYQELQRDDENKQHNIDVLNDRVLQDTNIIEDLTTRLQESELRNKDLDQQIQRAYKWYNGVMDPVLRIENMSSSLHQQLPFEWRQCFASNRLELLLSPLPLDLGVERFHGIKNEIIWINGYDARALLPLSLSARDVGIDDETYHIWHCVFPAWLHHSWDFDPPKPSYYPSGLLLNSQDGLYPAKWNLPETTKALKSWGDRSELVMEQLKRILQAAVQPFHVSS